jgi:hypothetical protein
MHAAWYLSFSKNVKTQLKYIKEKEVYACRKPSRFYQDEHTTLSLPASFASYNALSACQTN